MGVAVGGKAQYDPRSSREVEWSLSTCDWYCGWARTDGWLVVLISWALPGVGLHQGGVRITDNHHTQYHSSSHQTQ